MLQCSYSGCLTELFGSLAELTRLVKPALRQRSGDEVLGELLTWGDNGCVDPIWEQLRDESFTGACQWLSDTLQRYNGMQVG